ncbi:putative mannosyltransferase-like protein [Trypanosoma cruzi]|uniref:Mannosyltransferase-like protein, putative n=1 Tax=Trypanosoma cruzi (strain CL Brener) TaxID=353153 RepID=Q4CRW1_TRYCC|nr:mannosyltransferase-like protein, putative [Trypanosoma cruzi]EAN83012.1 mannosyltransferase-like protein, putative [Trypanosoma cruzi]RNC53904.1 putative mannosyltransferase-like protein [Trypanosoma cruzi]|eukprot:XP_804863.1 mannosyltransferase-like protein [Trypanosoma cruzi strain CL Brener]
MRYSRSRSRGARGRARTRRKYRAVISLLVLLFCLYLFLRILPPRALATIRDDRGFLIPGGNTSSVTVVITELRVSASFSAANLAGSRLKQALSRRAWCTSSSPMSLVSLVMLFYAPPDNASWSGGIPVSIQPHGDSGSWNLWSVDLAKRGIREKYNVAPCVMEARVLFAASAGKVESDSYGMDLAAVRVALRAVRRTDYFVLLADFVRPKSDDFMEKLFLPSRRNGGKVLAVQCTLLEKKSTNTEGIDKGQAVVPDALHVVSDRGVFVGLAALKRLELLLPYLLRRYNGIFATDKRLLEPELVDAVSPFCTLFHRQAFDAVKGFDSLSFSENTTLSRAPDIAGWEYSIFLQREYKEWQVWSSAAFGIIDEGTSLPSSLLQLLRQPAFPAADNWGAEHFDTLQRLHNRRFATPYRKRGEEDTVDKPLSPLLFFARDYNCSCCGLMREVIGYLRPLTERYAVSFLRGLCRGFCSDAVGSELVSLELTDELRAENFFTSFSNSVKWQIAYKNRPKIVIMHLRAPSYKDVHASLPHKMDYFIGRSLSEFSLIPRDWVDGMHRYADEVWATGEFFRTVYRRSGVAAEKIHVVPESVNIHRYNPLNCRPPSFPLSLPTAYTNRPGLSPEDLRRRFRFLSVMKWEMRKGWDVLLKAYWKAFGPSSPLHNSVSLYLKVKWIQLYSGGAGNHNINELIGNWSKKNLPGFTSMEDMPHIVFLSGLGYVGEQSLLQLYCSVDAFVFPTRAEGWGLPATEAMAMGIPVIITNWGGTTTFMPPNATFGIRVDGLEEVPSGAGYRVFRANKWALPSVQDTAELMRYVVDHPEHARRVGKRGRRHMEEYFSEEIIADLFDMRLEAAVRKLRGNSQRGTKDTHADSHKRGEAQKKEREGGKGG